MPQNCLELVFAKLLKAVLFVLIAYISNLVSCSILKIIKLITRSGVTNQSELQLGLL